MLEPMASKPNGLADIRKIAFVTFIASTLSLLAPSWNMAQTIVGIESRQHVGWWRPIPMAALALLFSAIMPVFYFALYRNRGTFRIPKLLRQLSLAAAIVLGLFVVAAVRVEFLDPDFAARGGGTDPTIRTVSHIISLLGPISNATLALLLISFFLQPDHESAADDYRSRFLDQATKVAVICYGIVLAFLVIRALLTPYTYSTLKDFALQNGRTPPPFSALLEEAIRTLVIQTCLFMAPYVIFKSQALALTGDVEPFAGDPEILPKLTADS
jgi:hypothetical protein